MFHNAVSVYKNATILAGQRVNEKLVDTSLQSGYMMMDTVAKTPQEAASEYYQVDWVIELYKCMLPTLLKHPAAMQVHIKMMRGVFTNSHDALLRWRGMLGTSLRENVHLYIHPDSRTDVIDCVLMGLSAPLNHKNTLTM